MFHVFQIDYHWSTNNADIKWFYVHYWQVCHRPWHVYHCPKEVPRCRWLVRNSSTVQISTLEASFSVKRRAYKGPQGVLRKEYHWTNESGGQETPLNTFYLQGVGDKKGNESCSLCFQNLVRGQNASTWTSLAVHGIPCAAHLHLQYCGPFFQWHIQRATDM